MTIPAPEPGLVISYAYPWHREHLAGHEEGRKNRPAVIVLIVERPDNRAPMVTVLPITHSPPNHPRDAVEIPPAVKRHLGLDDNRSWIAVSEGNDFVWPGYDLIKIPSTDRHDYGFLPPRFFDQIMQAFIAYAETGRARRTPRD